MSSNLPAILSIDKNDLTIKTVEKENAILIIARKLYDAGFYDHSLLEIWNAAIYNIRRKVEAYGAELFISVVKDDYGKQTYNEKGDSIIERWCDINDSVLIIGATKIGVLNKKAGKSLEMINWMRNHITPAHDTDQEVKQEDVIAFSLILTCNLFNQEIPEPGHSVSSLFDPMKSEIIDINKVSFFKDQIDSLRQGDVRIAFGFMLDMICKGNEPAYSNSKMLFPIIWEKGTDELRRNAALKYHTYLVDISKDDSDDKGAKGRLLGILVNVSGIKYIPDMARAYIYRYAASNLARAKNSRFGWEAEVTAAKTLEQLGASVPSVAFVEVYQEILSVYCGNYWGRSSAFIHLKEFIDSLNTKLLIKLVEMFKDNNRVRSELFQNKPKREAIELLNYIKDKLNIEANKGEVEEAIKEVKSI